MHSVPFDELTFVRSKGHFQFAKYIDSMLESRIIALQRRSPAHFAGVEEAMLSTFCIAHDKTCQINVSLAIHHYVESLALDANYVYQALPRLLSLWFDFTSIKKSESVQKYSLSDRVGSAAGKLMLMFSLQRYCETHTPSNQRMRSVCSTFIRGTN
jgi:hypothetical protein